LFRGSKSSWQSTKFKQVMLGLVELDVFERDECSKKIKKDEFGKMVAKKQFSSKEALAEKLLELDCVKHYQIEFSDIESFMKEEETRVFLEPLISSE